MTRPLTMVEALVVRRATMGDGTLRGRNRLSTPSRRYEQSRDRHTAAETYVTAPAGA